MKKLAGCLLLAMTIGGVYYNALGNGFVFDDYLLVVNRSAIPEVAANPLLALSPGVVGYRPLRTLSYVLDYKLGGLHPWVFHLSNFIYHWITACLVFLVAFLLAANEKVASLSDAGRRTLDAGRRTPDARLRTALFAAVLWAVHPIQTEAVTYISGRRDILTGLFFFLGLYAFLRIRALDFGLRTGGRVLWVGIAFLAYGLGLLSKEMAVTLPLVMLGYDYVYAVQLQEVRGGWQYIQELGRGAVRAVWSHKYLYLPLLLGGLCFSWYAAFVVLPSWRVGWYGGSLVNNFLTTARIWVYYLYLLLWPMRLLADYTGAFAVTRSLLDSWALLALAFLFALWLLALGVLRYSRLAAFSFLWFAITLLPVSHLIPYPEMMAEHYLYIPAFGFCFLVALVLGRLTEGFRFHVSGFMLEKESSVSRLPSPVSGLWKPVIGYGLLVSFLAFYAGRTVVRNRDWRDDLTFYARLVAENPSSARARLGLGYVYDRSGLPRMAITHYQMGLRITPRDPRLLTNIGAAYQKLGELKAAEQAYLISLQVQPHNSKTLNNLGFLYTEKKEFDKARSFLEQAKQLSGGRDSAVYANFGLLYELQGKVPEALKAYRKAKALDPADDISSQKIEELEKKLGKQDHSSRDATAAGGRASP